MYMYILEIILDLPFGFPINNIISLYVRVTHAHTHTHKQRARNARQKKISQMRVQKHKQKKGKSRLKVMYLSLVPLRLSGCLH